MFDGEKKIRSEKSGHTVPLNRIDSLRFFFSPFWAKKRQLEYIL
jgi:hypothetical protein